jgi:hypothetical protein
MSEYDDAMCLDDHLDDDDLNSMRDALHDEGLMGVEQMFTRPVSLPPLPLLVPVPPVLSVPVLSTLNTSLNKTAWTKAWTDAQDTWLKEKYSQKPNTGNWEDTERYWHGCATEFEKKFFSRTPAALVKRVSLLGLSSRKRVLKEGASSKRVGASSTYQHQQWPLDAEKWIARNVRANAHLSNRYLQSVASAIREDFPNEGTRSIEALRSKIKRMRPHLN